MVSALGRLNSQLLTAQYSPSMPSIEHALSLYKQACGLHNYGVQQVETQLFRKEQVRDEVNTQLQHAITHHISKTWNPDALCLGPCVHISPSLVEQIKNVRDAQALAPLVPTLVDNAASIWAYKHPRLCQSTGIPCAVTHVPKIEVAQQLLDADHHYKLAQEVCKETEHTMELATLVLTSLLRGLEVKKVRNGDKLRGGAKLEYNTSTPDQVHTFFKTNFLGPPSDEENIRASLDNVVQTYAPRARTAIRHDLWRRWVQFKKQSPVIF